MSANHGRGGRIVLGEQLPSGYFDDLAAKIWQIGNAAFGEVLANPLPPSTFSASAIRVGNLALELGFEFRKNDITESAEPVVYHSALSEITPYPPLKDAEVWSWRRFELDMRRRRKVYECATSVVTTWGAIQLTETTNRRGTLIWQKAQQLGSICTRQDYDTYMENLQTVYEGIKAGEIEGE